MGVVVVDVTPHVFSSVPELVTPALEMAMTIRYIVKIYPIIFDCYKKSKLSDMSCNHHASYGFFWIIYLDNFRQFIYCRSSGGDIVDDNYCVVLSELCRIDEVKSIFEIGFSLVSSECCL